MSYSIISPNPPIIHGKQPGHSKTMNGDTTQAANMNLPYSVLSQQHPHIRARRNRGDYLVQPFQASAGDTGSIPESGRSPGGGHGNPLQYSYLENFMDRGAWQATVHGVAKSQTRLKRLSTHTHKLCLQFFLPLYWAVKAYRNFCLISFVAWLPSFSSK